VGKNKQFLDLLLMSEYRTKYTKKSFFFLDASNNVNVQLQRPWSQP